LSSHSIQVANHNMKNVVPIISYDPEADVLAVKQRSSVNIDHATELGNFIVHFTKNNRPVLIEILDASKIFGKVSSAFAQVPAVATV
jgi:hypothetical protein